MQWQGPSSDLNNAVVIERVNQFVKKLTQGHEQQQQDNFGERPIEDPDDTFVPLITSAPVQRRNVGQERRSEPATNVSLL